MGIADRTGYYLDGEGGNARVKLGGGLKGGDQLVSDITDLLTVSSFSSKEEYATLIKKVVSISKKHKVRIGSLPIHEKEIVSINRRSVLTEKTPWGGVSMKKFDLENNYIKKLLVINSFGALGFEYHKQKHERLRVLEGVALVLYSSHRSKDWKKGKVAWRIATVGSEFEFLPFDEHGIIALTDSVIEEQSTNHLDDLVYIYKL